MTLVLRAFPVPKVFYKMTPSIDIVPTGIANLASIRGAFERLGASTRLCSDPDQLRRATHLVLPGVGALGAAVDFLDRYRLREPLLARLISDKPTLGICLGMQLMGVGSQEDPSARGLGWIDCSAEHFPKNQIVPHMGWNWIEAPQKARILSSGNAYFAHSFRWTTLFDHGVARSCYGQGFVAGFERGRIVGCQFHPEISGEWGLAILERFMKLEPSC